MIALVVLEIDETEFCDDFEIPILNRPALTYEWEEAIEATIKYELAGYPSVKVKKAAVRRV